jgi:hypothetical protein
MGRRDWKQIVLIGERLALARAENVGKRGLVSVAIFHKK